MESPFYRLIKYIPVFIIFISATENTNPITATEIATHIRYLAADKLKGRHSGSSGFRLAIQYIEKNWKKTGVLPAGSIRYKQPFKFTSALSLYGYNRLKINETRRTYRVKKDFMPLSFSGTGIVSAPVVFAGYGFSTEDSVSWNDYEGVDVSEKWVLVFRGSPEGSSPHSSFADYMPLRKKYITAKDKQVAGVLFVNRFNDDKQEGLLPLRYRRATNIGSVPAIHISQAVAAQLLGGDINYLKQIQLDLDTECSARSFHIGVTVAATVGLKEKKSSGTNVVGLVPGDGTTDEIIVIGAHIDHLGYGGWGSGSLVPDVNEIHNGADDNASGIAGLLEIAEKLATAKTKLSRDVLFIAFDAEEKGLLGSKFFVDNPTVDLNKVITMINMDMIGRLQDSTLTVGGTGTAPMFEPLLDSLQTHYGLQVNYSKEGFGPSDHSSFYGKDIPVLFFFTGTHEDYHKPSDDWEKINSSGAETILKMVVDIVTVISSREEKPVFTVAGSKERWPQPQFKVTFGIIPSYAGSAQGLTLDGVRSGGPAEKAGLLKEDVIIAIDGKEVRDIYEYMYRLSELKKGQSTVVKVRRGTEILTVVVEL